MLALLLATLILAQATPADASPAPAGAIASPTSDAPSALPQRIGFPRGPRRMPVETPPLAAGDALIRNSGSTNFSGYAIVVHPDGMADVADAAGTSRRAVGAAQVKWLFAKLHAAGPLDALPTGRCMKSASFGSSTSITYAGATTPDLSCGVADPAARELARTAGVIADQLGVAALGGVRRTLP